MNISKLNIGNLKLISWFAVSKMDIDSFDMMGRLS